MKLVVGTPWDTEMIWTRAVKAMLNMKHPEGVEVEYVFGRGWCPSRKHNDICEQALDAGADLICIIGADQIHPSDMLVKLYQRFVETDGVITALVPFRGYVGWQDMKPFQPLGWRLECEGMREFRGQDLDGDMMKTIDPEAGELQKISVIGSGVLMFHRDHLLSLKKPWFYDRADPETMHRVADMDSKFVWRLQSEAGARVWVDTTIKVRHLHAFEIDESYQERFADWAEDGKGDPSICRYRARTQTTMPATQAQ